MGSQGEDFLRLTALNGELERAIEKMYEPCGADAGYALAKDALGEAIALCLRLGLHEETERFEQRLDETEKIFRDQFPR